MKIRARKMHNRGRIAIVGVIDYPHDEVLDLVIEALKTIGAPSHTEVHIRGTNSASPAGMAYGFIPHDPACLASAQRLISIRFPRAAKHRLPRVDRCYRGKADSSVSWPRYDIHTWQEDLFHLACHEARHIVQYAHGYPNSELDCERRATAALNNWRKNR